MHSISLLFTTFIKTISLSVFAVISQAVLFQTAMAQNTPSTALDKLPKHCHFSSQFNQKKVLPSLPVPLISSGRMYFSCQAGLIWETQQPIRESLIFTRLDHHFKQLDTEMEILDSIETRFLSRLLIGLMGADKEYIQATFTIAEVNDNTFTLTPKGDFLRKAINSVTIERSKDADSLSILIDQKDSTSINIETHSAIILDNVDSHMNYCLQSNHAENHCQALFEPLKMINQLNNAGS